MPITSSAKKALRQSKRKRLANITYLNKIKLVSKEFKKTLAKGETKQAKELLPKLYKALDKATKSNVLKKNTAARRKSRATITLNKAGKK